MDFNYTHQNPAAISITNQQTVVMNVKSGQFQ